MTLGKKKKIILHIGTHKTGSTSIQTLLYHNAERLLSNDVDYLEAHCIWKTAHHPLGWCMQNDFENIDATYDYDKSKGVIHSYIQAIKKSTASTIIISTETLFMTSDYRKLAKFHKLLCDDYDFEIAVYLRHQSAFLYSWYCELVTAWYGKITSPFSTFLENPRYLTNYKKVLDKWGELFGKENVKVFSFENSSSGGNLLLHFVDNLMPDVKTGELNFPQKPSRVSLSPGAVEFTRRLNALDITDDERQEKIKNLVDHESKEKSRVVIETSHNIYHKYKVVNNDLLQAYGVDLNSWYNNI